MESLKKILPYLLIAIVFAVGGYFIGQGKLNDQGAALYKGTSSLNPCDNSPTNPCPENRTGTGTGTGTKDPCPDGTCPAPDPQKVGNKCPAGTTFMNGKCVPSAQMSDEAVLASLKTNPQWASASINIRQIMCEVWFSGAGLTPAQAKARCATIIATVSSTNKN